MKYVYEIRENGIPIYVGESKNPQKRFRQHTMWQPSPGNGTFYGRTNLQLAIIAGPISVREARDLEDELKIKYGMPLGERIGAPVKPKLPKVYKRRQIVSEEDVIEIKAKYKPRKYTLERLAKEYNVGVKTIHRIITNEYGIN